MLHISDIPKYEALGEQAKLFPGMDPVATEAFAVLLHTGDRLKATTEQWLGSHGTSHGRFVVMMLLHREGRSMPASELATRVGVTKQTITSLLDGLTKDGYIERCACEGDRRVCLVALTASGRSFLEKLYPEVFEAHRTVMAALTSDENRELARLLRKLWGSLEPLGKREE